MVRELGECATFDYRKPEEAIRIFEKGSGVKHHPAIYLSWGTALQEQNKFDEAEEKFRKAMNLNPEYAAEAKRAIAQGLSEQGKSEKAIEMYENMIDLYPEMQFSHAIAYSNWGHQLNEQGKYKEAIPKFEKSIEIWPLPVAYANWGYSLFNLGDFRGAITKYQKIIEIEPNNADAYYNWGQSLRA